MSESNFEVYRVAPLSESEIDVISYVAIASATVVLITFIILLSVQFIVAFKTNLPGRFISLIGALSGAIFVSYEYYMGGNLEFVFGPIGQLYSTIGYSLAITVFSIGQIRLIRHIYRLPSGS